MTNLILQAMRSTAMELFAIVSIWLCMSSGVRGAEAISVQYPNDSGIEKDSAVLFVENFESGDLKKWDSVRGSATVTTNGAHAGKFCSQMELHRGGNPVSDTIKWFMPGADTVYVRFYVRFSADYQYCHHFVWLGANQSKNKWSSFGKAGLKPDGTYFSAGMEPAFAWGKNPPPGEVTFYSYFMDMERDPKMDKYWGNSFYPPGPDKGTAAGPQRVIPQRDQWQCWEFMIQANTAADKADGKQAMWIDGKRAGEFTGIRWRTDMNLKINSLWLEHYAYDGGDPTKRFWKEKQTVWFDDVVVATRYIGPMIVK